MIDREKVLHWTEKVTSALPRMDDLFNQVTRYHKAAQQTTSPEQLDFLSIRASIAYIYLGELSKKYFVVASGLSDIEKQLLALLVDANAHLDRLASGEITTESFYQARAKSDFTGPETLDQYVQHLETERSVMQKDHQMISREIARLDAYKAKINQMISKGHDMTKKIENIAGM